jgi:hypothetical protein
LQLGPERPLEALIGSALYALLGLFLDYFISNLRGFCQVSSLFGREVDSEEFKKPFERDELYTIIEVDMVRARHPQKFLGLRSARVSILTELTGMSHVSRNEQQRPG